MKGTEDRTDGLGSQSGTTILWVLSHPYWVREYGLGERGSLSDYSRYSDMASRVNRDSSLTRMQNNDVGVTNSGSGHLRVQVDWRMCMQYNREFRDKLVLVLYVLQRCQTQLEQTNNIVCRQLG